MEKGTMVRIISQKLISKNHIAHNNRMQSDAAEPRGTFPSFALT
jgi:hypothetical protein